MSDIPSDIDMLTDAVQSAMVTASPTSKNSDDKELSWSNVEDTDDDSSSPRVTIVQNELPASPAAEVQPVAEAQPVEEAQPAEAQPVAEAQPAEDQPEEAQPEEDQPAEDQPAEDQPEEENNPVLQKVPEVQKMTVPPLTIDESSDDEMPPLVSDESSDDEMPQLVESSDEESSEESTDEESTDEDMPELVSDDDDVLHMIIRDSSCPVCHSAIQTLLNHDHNSTNQIEETLTPPKNEVPPMIIYTLWLFILLHAFNLLSTFGGVGYSR